MGEAYQRVILVTGSNTGIGFEIVRQLAQKGHIVYLSSRNEASGKEAIAKLKAESNLDVKYVQLDITDVQTVQNAKDLIEKNEGRLDSLVNNAGIGCMDKPQTATNVELSTIREAFEANFYGTIQTTLAFLPLIRKSKRGYGVICNVTIDMASNSYMARPDAPKHLHFVAYNTSKAALNSYSISLAVELKEEEIKVNVVTPGFTTTKLNGFRPGGKTPAQGAETIIKFVDLGPEDKDITGKFIGPEGNEFPW